MSKNQDDLRNLNYLFKQIDFIESILEDFMKQSDSAPKDEETQMMVLENTMLLKTLISNLWELKNEKYGGPRPVGDILAYANAKKGGGRLIDAQIGFLIGAGNQLKTILSGSFADLELYQDLQNNLELGDSVIDSLNELKAIKSKI